MHKACCLTIAGQTYASTIGYKSRSERMQLTYPNGVFVNREYTDRREL